MPGMDGVQVIKLVRERWPKLAIVAMSGVALNDSAHTALDFFALNPELAKIPKIKKAFSEKSIHGSSSQCYEYETGCCLAFRRKIATVHFSLTQMSAYDAHLHRTTGAFTQATLIARCASRAGKASL